MISTMRMDDLPTRKQRIAQILSKDHQVIYLYPPVTVLGALKTKKIEKSTMQEWSPQLHIIQPPLILPFGLRFNFIRKINAYFLRKFLRTMLRKKHFHPDIIWFYLVDYPEITHDYADAVKVYDCVDDHSAYPGFRNPGLVLKLEKKLVQSCDAVFATTLELSNKLSKNHDKVVCIPNGVDWQHFGNPSIKEHTSLSPVPSPRIGYLGAIHQWFDLALIEYLLQHLPEAHFVLAGPSQRNEFEALGRKYPHLHMLGRIDVKNAPSVIKSFDVALIPFIPNDLTLNISPLKFFEYCAQGKPTVSIPIAQLKSYQDICYLYHDHKECLDMINQALHEPELLQQKRKDIARENSWDQKLDKMFNIALQHLN